MRTQKMAAPIPKRPGLIQRSDQARRSTYHWLGLVYEMAESAKRASESSKQKASVAHLNHAAGMRAPEEYENRTASKRRPVSRRSWTRSPKSRVN